MNKIESVIQYYYSLSPNLFGVGFSDVHVVEHLFSTDSYEVIMVVEKNTMKWRVHFIAIYLFKKAEYSDAIKTAVLQYIVLL